MINKMLKLAGVKDEKSFYKKYPNEEAFMQVHGEAFNKLLNGGKLKKQADESSLMMYYGEDGIEIDPTKPININKFNYKPPTEDSVPIPDFAQYTPFTDNGVDKQGIAGTPQFNPIGGLQYGDTANQGKMPSTKKKSNFDIGKTIAASLMGLSAAMPEEQVKMNGVSPATMPYYNPNPSGTGSGAIMEDGGYVDPFTITDNRKVDRATGLPITDKNKLTSKTDTDLVKSIVKKARKNGIDPSEALAMAFQETGLNMPKPNKYFPDPIKASNPFMVGARDEFPGGVGIGEWQDKTGEDSIGTFMALYKNKLAHAKKGSEASRIQSWNGYGNVKDLYGLKGNINMSENPVYGNRILDIKENIISKDPTIQKILNEKLAMGGGLPGASGMFYARSNDSSKGTDFQPKSMRMGGHFKPEEQWAFGGKMSSAYEQGGELQLYSPDSEAAHLSESIVKFNGAEHGEKNAIGSEGIPLQYGGNPVEVENDETGYSTQDGGFTVLGKMTNPLTGRMFKNDGKALAKKEVRVSKQMTKGNILMDESDIQNPFELLKFNSGKAKTIGAKAKEQQITQEKETLAALQQHMLDFAEINNLDPNAMSKGKMKTAKYGINIPQAPNGIKMPKGVNMDDLYMNKVFSDELKRIGGKNAMDGRWGPNHKKAYDYAISKGVIFDPSNRETNTPFTPEEKIAYDTGAFVNFQNLTGGNNYNWETQNSVFETNPKATAAIPYVKNKILPDNSVDFNAIGKKVGEDMIFAKPEQPTGVTFDDVSPIAPIKNDVMFKGANWKNYIKPGYVLATNKTQPVRAQMYNPRLEQTYQSEVDLNPIIANNRATQLALSGNAAEAATATALGNQQIYSAQGQGFAQNQDRAVGVYNRNNATINDAQLKNLGIADQQYTRQTQADANTRRMTTDALGQIGEIDLQNKRDWNNFNVQKQLFPTYGVDDNYQLNVTNPYQFNIPEGYTSIGKDMFINPKGEKYKVKKTTDGRNQLVKTEKTTEKGKYGISITREFKSYKP